MTLKVFISYAKEDQGKALHYYDLLTQEGVMPWLDIKALLPGQNWEAEIERAFSDANVVILLLSRSSVTKRGFVQREANDAIDRLRYKLPTDIYVIPLLLEECEVPSQIAKRLQYVNLEKLGAWDQVRASLQLAAKQQSIELSQGIAAGPFRVFSEKLQEKWKGLPGYNIDIAYPRFESSLRSQTAHELSAYFSGRAYDLLIKLRQKPWDQSPDIFSEDNPAATNERWDTFDIVHATKDLISIVYGVGWYYAGAMHPNSNFETYNFFIYQERIYRLTLSDLLVDLKPALELISSICIRELEDQHLERLGEKPGQDQMAWFERGAGPDLKNFEAFTISSDHLTILFPPYQVSAYALGKWSANLPFSELKSVLMPNGLHLRAVE